MSAGARVRLITIVAPPGYGKTTLLTDWAGRARSAWHTVTSDDRELLPALNHLVRALRTTLPRLDFTLPTVAGDAHAIAASLCDALPAAELLLVLDDVHLIGVKDPSAKLLEALCQQLPPNVRLVLSSRRQPPFAVQRLRQEGRLLELTAGDLAFTRGEVAGLLAGCAGLDGVSPNRVHRATGGWPIAAQLVGDALRHGRVADADRALSSLREPGSLFDEVFDAEPRRTRELIRTAARFDRFRPELLEALGHPAAGEIIAELVGRGLFVESPRSAPGWFGLMPLMKEFARARMPMRDWELRELCDVAARWFRANGYLDAAFAALAEVQDLDGIRRLLDERADELLRQGGADAVIAAVRLLPPEARDARTWQLAGEAYQVRGDWELALECLQRTVSDRDPLTPDVARRIGWLHYFSGAPAEALEVCHRCVLTGADPAAESLLLSCVASAQWARGELDACRTAASHAMTLALACADDTALAAAHTVFAMFAAAKGDPVALASHNRDGLRHAERAGDVLSVIRIRSNRASHLIEEGDYHAALAELEVVLPLADLTGFATYRGLCLSSRGEARLAVGQLDEAAADLVAARNILTGVHSSLAAVPLSLLAEVYRLRGDRVPAKSAYREAIRLAEGTKTVTQLVPALAGLARLLVDDEPEASAELVARALSFGTGIGHAAALLASAALELGCADGESALRSASEAELLARKRGDNATLAESLELQARAHLLLGLDALSLVDAAAVIWRELGNRRAESRISALRDAAAGVSRPAPPGLVIQTLGGFRVLRGGELIPVAAWQSRKARDLVKILVARRGRPLTREALISLLWPGEPAGRAGNRLSVALSTARTILRGATTEHCIVTDSDTVRLDTGVAVVDVLVFLSQAQLGLQAWQRDEPEALPALRAAEASYTGDFLEEDPYEDWATPLREEARLTYIQVATVLTGHAAAMGEHVAASRYCLRILERDEFNEPAYLALVRALASAGSHGEARRWYRTYVDRMAEISVEPRPFPRN